MAGSKKNKTPMEKLTQGYEKFIKDKELKENGKELFEKAIKKAVNIKQRSSK
jgi:hypothetical protein